MPLYLMESTFNRRIVVTWQDPLPIEITPVASVQGEDSKPTHTDSDTNLVKQMVLNATKFNSGACVVSVETSVFVLLL